jgi:hypothetical protein
MRRTIVVISAAAVTALSSGCTPVTSPLDLAGTYTLKTVNGAVLPYQIPQVGPTSVVALNDEFTLTPDGTYAESGQEQVTTAGIVSISPLIDAGDFTRRNDALTLESLLFGARPATVSGTTLTLVQNGLTLVYRK